VTPGTRVKILRDGFRERRGIVSKPKKGKGVITGQFHDWLFVSVDSSRELIIPFKIEELEEIE